MKAHFFSRWLVATSLIVLAGTLEFAGFRYGPEAGRWAVLAAHALGALAAIVVAAGIEEDVVFRRFLAGGVIATGFVIANLEYLRWLVVAQMAQMVSLQFETMREAYGWLAAATVAMAAFAPLLLPIGRNR